MKLLIILITLIITAINAFAVGIIGGGFEDSGEKHYVAIISSSGVATPIAGPAFPKGNGTISSLAMNASGSAIIGGMENGATAGTPYIALISPSGTSSRISGYVPKGPIGQINSVAINDAGSAIAVGVHQKNDADYIALISPKGIAKAVSGTLPILPANIHQASINSQSVALVGGVQKITCRSTTPNLFYLAFISPQGIATPIKGAVPRGAGHIDA
ncbi:MAG: hypothetical protein HRU43_03940, partial [Simkaniaceae bacterium]|nr:hypothetical protein [Simkaniaceae bacterium]